MPEPRVISKIIKKKIVGRHEIFLPLIVKPAPPVEEIPRLDVPFASKEEEWVYEALLYEERMGTIGGFEFQKPVFGGRLRRGGQVIDFVVYNPRATAVFVNGEYWHSGLLGADEQFNQERIRRAYPVVVTFWDWEMPDRETTHKLTHEWMVVRAGQPKE